MSNNFYSNGGTPATGSSLSSANMRAEFAAVEAGFDKMPTLTGNGNKLVVVDAGGTALATTDTPDINGGTIDDAAINLDGGSLVLPLGASAAPTDEGAVYWNSSTDKLTVGTGAAAKQMVDLDSSQVLTNKTISAGSVYHGTAVAVAYGGTGAATKTAGFDALSPATTAGDLIYHDGTNNARLPKGTANQFLQMNSGGTAPAWQTFNAIGYPGAGMAVSTGSAWGTSKATPSGDVVGTTDTQTLSGKTITGTKEVKVALSGTAIDCATGNYFSKTISTNTAFSVTNVPSTGTGYCFLLDLTNGGFATTAFWSGVKWPLGAAPTLSISGRDVLMFFTHDGGTTWNGFLLGKGMA